MTNPVCSPSYSITIRVEIENRIGIGAEIKGFTGQGPRFSISDPVSCSLRFFRLYPDPRPLIPEKRRTHEP